VLCAARRVDARDTNGASSIEAGSTTRNAVEAGPGTSTDEAVLLASSPWLQCCKQSGATVLFTVPAVPLQSCVDALLLTAWTGPRNELNTTEQACTATAPCRNRKPRRAMMATTRRGLRPMFALEHTEGNPPSPSRHEQCSLDLDQAAGCGPRTSRPGRSPVGTPSRRTMAPLTMVAA
jgi:hypothetical protein